MDAKRIIELRKQAEKAVEDMQDGEFKLKAFEVILGHLLAPEKAEVIRESTPRKEEKGSIKKKDAGTIAGRVLVLKDEGFMKAPKTITQIRAELQAHGWNYPVTTLSGGLINLVRKRNLRRTREKIGKKQIYVYSNP